MFLEIKNLSAGYGGFEVLRRVSLSLAAGEAVVLIGPNGAGKSTVLKSVMGLTTQTGGQIFWQGQEMASWPTHARLRVGLGFVPQGRLIFSSLTVQENLEIGGYLIDRQEVLKENLAAVFDHFPVLRQKQKERAGALSGGEQQMLAIGRALVTRPKLLMLDEPSLGLAPKVTQEVFQKLMAIKAAGATLLIVEQNVRLALRYVDRGYLLAGGEVRFAGQAKELSNEKLMREAYLI